MPRNKFKPGDKVVIIGYQHGIDSMQKMVGTEHIIRKIQGTEDTDDPNYVHWYYLVDDPWFVWQETWLDFADKQIEINEIEFETLLKE